MGQLIKDAAILEQKLAELRKQGKTIVTTNGCFDLLHRGHVHLLRTAEAQGDVVVVGLNSDISVRLNKGDRRPLIPEEERAEVLCAFEMVDIVYLFDEKDCIEFVRLARPDIHINDASYGENCIESDAVKQGGGRLHLAEKIQSPSTTSIIEKVKNE